MSEDSLFGIDTNVTASWNGTTFRGPSGVDRNRACARDWTRDRARGDPHPRDGYVAALMRLMLERG